MVEWDGEHNYLDLRLTEDDTTVMVYIKTGWGGYLERS